MRSLLIRLPLAGLLWLAPAAQGQEATVPGEAVVADRTAAVRAQALPRALADALQRLSPRENPGEGLDLAGAASEEGTLLQRFEYAQVTRPTPSGIPSIRLMLRAHFDAVAARTLLVQAGVPVWRGGDVRPTVWRIDEDAQGARRLVEGSGELAFEDAWQALARRGVLPRWPGNDLADWRMAEELTAENAGLALAEAAQRSLAETALLAWSRPVADGVQVTWRVVDGSGSERSFESGGPDLATAASEGVPRLVAVLGEIAAVQPQASAAVAPDLDRGPGDYVVWIENLEAAGDYSTLVALLSAQPPVAAVLPEQAAGQRVRLRLTLREPLGRLLALLAADGRLERVAEVPGDADLTLRWLGD